MRLRARGGGGNFHSVLFLLILLDSMETLILADLGVFGKPETRPYGGGFFIIHKSVEVGAMPCTFFSCLGFNTKNSALGLAPTSHPKPRPSQGVEV